MQTKKFINRSILLEEKLFKSFIALLNNNENFNRVVNKLIQNEVVLRVQYAG